MGGAIADKGDARRPKKPERKIAPDEAAPADMKSVKPIAHAASAWGEWPAQVGRRPFRALAGKEMERLAPPQGGAAAPYLDTLGISRGKEKEVRSTSKTARESPFSLNFDGGKCLLQKKSPCGKMKLPHNIIPKEERGTLSACPHHRR